MSTARSSGAKMASRRLRLGLCLVKSLSRSGAQRLVDARARSAPSPACRISPSAPALDRGDLEALAAAGALASLSGNRHLAFWEVAGTEKAVAAGARSTRRPAQPRRAHPLLRAPTPWQNVLADYARSASRSARIRWSCCATQLAGQSVAARRRICASLPSGAAVRVAGIVLMRQHPGSANGVTFVTLEDETGSVNIIVWPKRRRRAAARRSWSRACWKCRGSCRRETASRT